MELKPGYFFIVRCYKQLRRMLLEYQEALHDTCAVLQPFEREINILKSFHKNFMIRITGFIKFYEIKNFRFSKNRWKI
jgi:hypothetical protein